jgi:hypothetical protein
MVLRQPINVAPSATASAGAAVGSVGSNEQIIANELHGDHFSWKLRRKERINGSII